jgi:hypothetical protein
VGALGSQGGISKSQISHICKEIDQQVQAFLNRRLQVADYAYLYLNATYLKGRLSKAQQVCSRAIWLKVGDGETEAFRPQRTQRLRSPPGGRCHNPRPPASQAPAAQHTSANERKMMCDFQVELDLERYAPEWLALQELALDGLVELSEARGRGLARVTAPGRWLIRTIAAMFDPEQARRASGARLV